MGLYDFTDNQWWNPLRHRRIVVRGSGGEIADDRLIRLADPTTPVASRSSTGATGHRPQPRGQRPAARLASTAACSTATRSRGTRLSEDDVAVADLLERDGRLGARRGAGALPARRRAAGPPAQRRHRRVGGDRPRRHDGAGGLGPGEGGRAARARRAAAARGPRARGPAGGRAARPRRGGRRLPQRLPLHDRRPAVPAPVVVGHEGSGIVEARRARASRRSRPATAWRCCGGRAAGAAATA